eukprot:NODE_3124_length_2089_cov_2.718145.p1 GENE.NODE_3124_length_2089_cov_2.718145~~NODE_3124_length_2089_cov_2.718145.p1  ORF type:complete len:556 (+),score=182.13 NODE_3124_length_2089_cov_2.718145:210-1877(+)
MPEGGAAIAAAFVQWFTPPPTSVATPADDLAEAAGRSSGAAEDLSAAGEAAAAAVGVAARAIVQWWQTQQPGSSSSSRDVEEPARHSIPRHEETRAARGAAAARTLQEAMHLDSTASPRNEHRRMDADAGHASSGTGPVAEVLGAQCRGSAADAAFELFAMREPSSAAALLPRTLRLYKKAKRKVAKQSRKIAALNLLRDFMSTDAEDINSSAETISYFDMPEDAGMHERWQAVLQGRSLDVVPDDELRWLIAMGTPLRHRHVLWGRWWARDGLGDVGELEQHASEDAVAQINLDIGRTLPHYLKDEQRAVLRRVLCAHAARRPDIGYCQGMNLIAAVPLLLCFSEADTFAALSHVVEKVCPGYHGPQLEGFIRDTAVLTMMVSYMLPDLQDQLESVGITMDMVCTDHLMTLSANTLPLNAVVRLWDITLMEGSPALLASFLALLQLYLPEAVAATRAAAVVTSCKTLTGCATSAAAPPDVQMLADITTRFRSLARAAAGRDIDELVHLSLKFVQLLRGEGEFLQLLRSMVEGTETEAPSPEPETEEEGTPSEIS